MAINKEKFIEDILGRDFEGNQARCAAVMGVDKSHLWLYLHNDRVKPNIRLLEGLYFYCKDKGYDPEKYIFPNRDNLIESQAGKNVQNI